MPEMNENPIEKPKSPAEMKVEAAVLGAVMQNLGTLEHWQDADAGDVQDVKTQLANAVGIQSGDDILVSSRNGRGGLELTVSSKSNPLMTHFDAYLMRGDSAFNTFKLAPRTDEARGNGEALVDALQLPASYREQAKDGAYADVYSKTPTTTVYKIVDVHSKAVLGYVEVNEETKQIGRVKRDEAAIEKTKPKPLDECMKAFSKEGRMRDADMKATVDKAVRAQLDLPKGFEGRALLLSATPGQDDTVMITVEDKETETRIAQMEYTLKFKDFASASIDMKAIKKILTPSF